MVQLIKRGSARFRIYIYDLKEKGSRCITIADGNEKLDDIKQMIEDCITKKNI